MQEKLQKLIWMLELALEVAKESLTNISTSKKGFEINSDNAEEVLSETIEKLKPKKKYQRRAVKMNDAGKPAKVVHECCGSKGTRHTTNCPEFGHSKERTGKYSSEERSERMRLSWKRRKASKTKVDPDNGKEVSKQPMRCSGCEEEFLHSGFLIDANCPSCGSSAVAPA